jgi:ApaG protein
MSEAVTQGIRVGATAFYLPQESDPDERRYAFGYRIVIVNEGDQPAQLLRRHWIIIVAEALRE